MADPMVLINYFVQMFFILTMWSLLWKENVVYRFAQYCVVAVAASTFALIALESLYKTAVSPIISGTNYLMIVPILAGILIFTNQTKKYMWISRYPLNIILGVGAALAIRGALASDVIGQITAMITLYTRTNTTENFINGIISLALAITTILYFFFFFLHKSKVYGGLSKIGRYSVMISFGVAFAANMAYNMTFVAYHVLFIFAIGPNATGVPSLALAGAILMALAFIAGAYISTKRSTNKKPGPEKK